LRRLDPAESDLAGLGRQLACPLLLGGRAVGDRSAWRGRWRVVVLAPSGGDQRIHAGINAVGDVGLGDAAHVREQLDRHPSVVGGQLVDDDLGVVGPDPPEGDAPEGIEPRIVAAGHTILAGLELAWPHTLGYHRVTLREEGELFATIGVDDPLVAIRHVGAGRTTVCTNGCPPHWAPPSVRDEWTGPARLFGSPARWLATV